MTAYGYARVSSNKQLDGYGLDVQRDAVLAEMVKRGQNAASIFFDEGVSGTLLDRPSLGDMLDLLGAGDTVVVARLDRLARDLIVQELLLADIKRKGATLVSCDAGENAYLADDAGDPSRKLIRQILGAVSEYERSTITMRMQAGIRAKKAAGGYAGGQPPYGWTGVGGELVEVPEEQRALRYMHECQRHGQNFEMVALQLNTRRFKTRKGKDWTRQSVRKVLLRQGTPAGAVRQDGGAVDASELDDQELGLDAHGGQHRGSYGG